MADPRHLRGLIDTSVVIGLELIEPADLPAEIAVSAITMAVAAGLALCTRKRDDFAGISELIEIVTV